MFVLPIPILYSKHIIFMYIYSINTGIVVCIYKVTHTHKLWFESTVLNYNPPSPSLVCVCVYRCILSPIPGKNEALLKESVTK